MTHVLSTLDDIEAHIGQPSGLVLLKTVDHLDHGALSWVVASTLVMASFGDQGSIGVTFGSGRPGWASGVASELRLPVASIDDPGMARPDAGFGSFFMIPSINEVLRVNGQVTGSHGKTIRVAIRESYVHCGKALLRSEFWQCRPADQPALSVEDVCAHARFLVLGTVDGNGHADASPKGDPAGTMVRCLDGRFWFADRPGNRRIDSFRNIVVQPKVSAVVLIPGSPYAARLTGVARVSDDRSLRACFAVEDKVPLLATGIEPLSIELIRSDALARADVWARDLTAPTIEPAKIAIGHIKLNKSAEAQQAAAAMSDPGLVERKMQADYKNNLY